MEEVPEEEGRTLDEIVTGLCTYLARLTRETRASEGVVGCRLAEIERRLAALDAAR